jgi:3-(3-hydroxy-phenyl)propionate hydroxylase
VVSVDQSPDQVVVEVRSSSGVRRHAGTYLIGADGRRSIVRKRSEIAFDGFTWRSGSSF